MIKKTNKENGKQFIEDLKHLLSLTLEKQKNERKPPNIVYLYDYAVLTRLQNEFSMGLTYEQKAELYGSKVFKMRQRGDCKCYSMGEKCKSHGVKYEK